mgnify:CR=1 FL=1|tara:strand:+ start:57 stop:698 length:642 start_codon:yes stop_codon:yes gene_type:complete
MTGGELEIAMMLGKFALGTMQATNQYKADNRKQDLQIQNANTQAAINNNLNYNAHLNLNDQQMLEMKKFGLDKVELQKRLRRDRASSIAIAASFGGTFGQSGATRNMINLNIQRQGFNALARKDFNSKNKLNDFMMRHKNVDLTTMSQNNQAFSRISSGGSASGTGLQIAGLALDAFGGYKGTTPNTITPTDPNDFGFGGARSSSSAFDGATY